MIQWVTFIISLCIFLISFFLDRRAFRNVFLMLFSLFFLVLAAATADSGSPFRIIIIYLVLLAGLAMLVMPFIFIWAGAVTIRREGFSLAHSLSILFALLMWGTFAFVIYALSIWNIPTAVMLLIVLLFMALFYILSTFMGFLLYSELCLILPKNSKCDFVIIHGAGLLRGTDVSPLLAGRLDKGIHVYRKSGPGTKIIVSGGKGGNEKVTEASAMMAYLREKGIPESDIIPEDRSKTTWENIKNSKEIIEEMNKNSRVIFVTNNYHVFRTGYYAHKQHLKACGVGCHTALYYWPNAFIREYIAIISRQRLIPLLIFAAWAVGSAIILLSK